MSPQFVAEILQRIDSVEFEMRSLEGRLTRIRQAIHAETNLARTYNDAGVDLKEIARRAADTSERLF